MVFLYFLACPDWRKGHGFPDFFPAGNRSGLDQSPSRIFRLSNRKILSIRKSKQNGSLESLTGFEGSEQINKLEKTRQIS